jgi:hypothetical protein
MLANRVGTFFILLGIALIALFILSDIAQSPICGLLFFGTIFLGLGIVLWTRNPAPPSEPSGRFRLMKKMGKRPDRK